MTEFRGSEDRCPGATALPFRPSSPLWARGVAGVRVQGPGGAPSARAGRVPGGVHHCTCPTICLRSAEPWNLVPRPPNGTPARAAGARHRWRVHGFSTRDRKYHNGRGRRIPGWRPGPRGVPSRPATSAGRLEGWEAGRPKTSCISDAFQRSCPAWPTGGGAPGVSVGAPSRGRPRPSAGTLGRRKAFVVYGRYRPDRAAGAGPPPGGRESIRGPGWVDLPELHVRAAGPPGAGERPRRVRSTFTRRSGPSRGGPREGVQRRQGRPPRPNRDDVLVVHRSAPPRQAPAAQAVVPEGASGGPSAPGYQESEASGHKTGPRTNRCCAPWMIPPRGSRYRPSCPPSSDDP